MLKFRGHFAFSEKIYGELFIQEGFTFFLEEIKAQREKEFNLLESTGLEAPNFTNSKHLETWLEWDGEFDSMLKEWILKFFRIFWEF